MLFSNLKNLPLKVDAEIIIDEKNSEFTFLLSKACTGITSAGFQHSGRFSIKDDLLLTSIYI